MREPSTTDKPYGCGLSQWKDLVETSRQEIRICPGCDLMIRPFDHMRASVGFGMDWVVDFQFVYGPQICAWGQNMGSCKIPIHLHRQEMSGRLPQLTALFPGPLRQPNLRRTFDKATILQLTCSSLLQIPHFGRSGTEDANTFRGHVFPTRDGTDVCCSHVLP